MHYTVASPRTHTIRNAYNLDRLRVELHAKRKSRVVLRVVIIRFTIGTKTKSPGQPGC